MALKKALKMSEDWTIRQGDDVLVMSDFPERPELRSQVGKVCAIQAGGAVALEFAMDFPDMHNCGGAIASGRGRWMYPGIEFEKTASVAGMKTAMYKYGREQAQWLLIRNLLGHESVHRFLLYGPPGTGKTTVGCKTAIKGHYSITVTPDTQVAEIIGHWIPKGDGFVWHYGVGAMAWKEGATLVVNEIVEAAGAVLTMFLAIMDDKDIARITLPNGETITPHADFRIVCTTNGSPNDLSDALRDRFDVMLKVDTPSPEAIVRLDEDLRDIVVNSYSNPDNISVTYRQLMAFGKLRLVLKEEEAGKIVFGTGWKDIKTAVKLNRTAKAGIDAPSMGEMVDA